MINLLSQRACMTLLAGVDGCKAGWIALVQTVDGGLIQSTVFATASALCRSLSDAEVIAVDIPIGLTDYGPRVCDTEARKRLGRPRASSVFPPPIRPALVAASREEASRIQGKIDGRRISAQVWSIIPKVREWDSCLRANNQIANRVFEVHPEVCFWALNAFKPMQRSKKTASGLRQRRELLEREFGIDAFHEIRSHHARREVADDDLYDAVIALWAARRIYERKALSLPESPPRDSVGLPMAIWY